MPKTPNNQLNRTAVDLEMIGEFSMIFHDNDNGELFPRKKFLWVHNANHLHMPVRFKIQV